MIPPFVQTELMGEQQASNANAMPLNDFIAEVMRILTDQPQVKEVVVDRAKPLRFAAEEGKMTETFEHHNTE